jgi:hypothetical protein
MYPRPAPPEDPDGPVDRRPRPLIERIGLACIALVMAALFAAVGVFSFVGGEPFLGVMGAIGCLMVISVGALTLVRG